MSLELYNKEKLINEILLRLSELEIDKNFNAIFQNPLDINENNFNNIYKNLKILCHNIPDYRRISQNDSDLEEARKIIQITAETLKKEPFPPTRSITVALST
jgi:hypothetical protein